MGTIFVGTKHNILLVVGCDATVNATTLARRWRVWGRMIWNYRRIRIWESWTLRFRLINWRCRRWRWWGLWSGPARLRWRRFQDRLYSNYLVRIHVERRFFDIKTSFEMLLYSIINTRSWWTACIAINFGAQSWKGVWVKIIMEGWACRRSGQTAQVNFLQHGARRGELFPAFAETSTQVANDVVTISKELHVKVEVTKTLSVYQNLWHMGRQGVCKDTIWKKGENIKLKVKVDNGVVHLSKQI